MSKKKPRGRPIKYELPEPIEMNPEELAQVVLKAKPKETWRFETNDDLTQKDRPD
ncbi:MAG: hypothetical protein OYI31_07235 [Chloroflexota bacterium]|nr:hypothetical protein [Chloroflexota bacterium]MDE2941011.1 hypothetical protein [Chloroflexota bacterium]MDE3268221.1 hypothetical protein [Chloroflexota bacterium]